MQRKDRDRDYLRGDEGLLRSDGYLSGEEGANSRTSRGRRRVSESP
jgi:hypothetical protein